MALIGSLQPLLLNLEASCETAAQCLKTIDGEVHQSTLELTKFQPSLWKWAISKLPGMASEPDNSIGTRLQEYCNYHHVFQRAMACLNQAREIQKVSGLEKFNRLDTILKANPEAGGIEYSAAYNDLYSKCYGTWNKCSQIQRRVQSLFTSIKLMHSLLEMACSQNNQGPAIEIERPFCFIYDSKNSVSSTEHPNLQRALNKYYAAHLMPEDSSNDLNELTLSIPDDLGAEFDKQFMPLLDQALEAQRKLAKESILS
jgi:hypothetical protein